jgi:putative spermidine/putrescine transport system permease protein
MTVAATRAPATTKRGAGKTSRRRSLVWLGLTPFAAYVLLFLAIPAVLAVGSGFFTRTGQFTFANLSAFANANVLGDFLNSFWVSGVTAVVGAIIGAIICFALLGTKPDGVLRTAIDSASSVLAQFGGITLAFAFVTILGGNGIITVWLATTFGIDTRGTTGSILYQVPGLVIVYLYFQVPLMVLTFMPAMEGLKATWGEATATLGGTRFTYWTRIAMPILAPAFFGSVILLFANAFSSYATAAALLDQGGIITLAIRQQSTSETIPGTANVAGILALGMVVVMVILMTAYSALQRRSARWER